MGRRWRKNFILRRRSIEQFRCEAPRGQVVEMKDATHYVFVGKTADEIVRLTREFLARANPLTQNTAR